jgi:hypothetical protein
MTTSLGVMRPQTWGKKVKPATLMRATAARRKRAMTAGLQPMPAPWTRTAEGRIAMEVGPPRGLLRLRAEVPAPSPAAETG